MALVFNGATKRIQLDTSTQSVRDLWSRWVDWVLTGDNSKYLTAMRYVGADDIDVAEGTKIPVYLYLMNGWKINLVEADGTTRITDGILLVDGGGNPFAPTVGDFNTQVLYQQPVQAISFATGGGGGGGALDLDEQLGDHQDPGTLGEAVKVILDNTDLTQAKINLL